MKKPIVALAAIAALFSITPGMAAAEEAKPKKNPFAVADANGDGRLDLAEYTEMMSGRPDARKAKARFAELDKDGDGFLTRQEVNSGRPKKDKNKAAAAEGREGDASKKAGKGKDDATSKVEEGTKAAEGSKKKGKVDATWKVEEGEKARVADPKDEATVEANKPK